MIENSLWSRLYRLKSTAFFLTTASAKLSAILNWGFKRVAPDLDHLVQANVTVIEMQPYALSVNHKVNFLYLTSVSIDH